jgi:hypothetical protein
MPATYPTPTPMQGPIPHLWMAHRANFSRCRARHSALVTDRSAVPRWARALAGPQVSVVPPRDRLTLPCQAALAAGKLSESPARGRGPERRAQASGRSRARPPPLLLSSSGRLDRVPLAPGLLAQLPGHGSEPLVQPGQVPAQAEALKVPAEHAVDERGQAMFRHERSVAGNTGGRDRFHRGSAAGEGSSYIPASAGSATRTATTPVGGGATKPRSARRSRASSTARV